MTRILVALTGLMMLLHLFSCTIAHNMSAPQEGGDRAPLNHTNLDRHEVYIYREASYSGGGRPHLLKIDDQLIGPLTGDNYYRIEMWPGIYHFSVSLPRQELFGTILKSMGTGKRIRIASYQKQHILLLRYRDGMSSGNFKVQAVPAPPADLLARQLAKRLDQNVTAQTKTLYDAEYTGPATGGRAHGKGILSWADGSQLIGIFEHGEITDTATFIFPDGERFIGLFRQGRPYRQGVLLNPAGDILFAGAFTGEKPDGLGLRRHANGAEFCFYSHGVDKTKTSLQIARETIAIEHAGAIQALWTPVIEIEQETGTRLEQLRREARSKQADLDASFMHNRYEHELTAVKLIRNHHQAQIDVVGQWCSQEFSFGKKPCICAPFAGDFTTWSECSEVHRLKLTLPEPRFLDLSKSGNRLFMHR